MKNIYYLIGFLIGTFFAALQIILIVPILNFIDGPDSSL